MMSFFMVTSPWHAIVGVDEKMPFHCRRHIPTFRENCVGLYRAERRPAAR
jgi:hypothetical protein